MLLFVGTGVVLWLLTVIALARSNVPLVTVTTTVVVAPATSAVRRVPTAADDPAWVTVTPTACAPKSVDGIVSVVPEIG